MLAASNFRCFPALGKSVPKKYALPVVYIFPTVRVWTGGGVLRTDIRFQIANGRCGSWLALFSNPSAARRDTMLAADDNQSRYYWQVIPGEAYKMEQRVDVCEYPYLPS